MEPRKTVVWLDLEGCIKVSDGILMIAHILIDQTPLNIDCLILGEKLLDLGELLEGLVEFLSSSIHQAKMEHGRDKCAAVL